MQSQRLNLLKLRNAAVVNITGKTGQKKACLVIPLEDAGLFAGDKGVYLDTVIVETQNSPYGDTHFVRQSVSKKRFEEMSEEERKTIPILGNIRSIQNQIEKQADTIQPDQVEDVLPF